MSKRVSIVAPDEAATTSRASSTPPKSPRDSSASKAKSTRASSQLSSQAKLSKSSEPSKETTTDSALVKVSTEDPFADGCERYKKDCCCCHCIEVRHSIRRAAYLRTPEGKKRLQMKMHMKNFFMDINAMTFARAKVENQLYGTKELHPSTQNSFPVSITKVVPIDGKCMSIEWYLHDDQNIDHYKIFIDNKLRKQVYNPKQTSTILLDVNMKRSYKLRLKAEPKSGLGSNADPMDTLVKDVCCGRMDKVLKSDYFCQCGLKSEMDKIEKSYKKNSCQTLIDFWKDSVFLYIPICSCDYDCDCDCYVPQDN